MSVDFAKTYDVVIIGGGPVGMGLAIELGQRGQSVAVIEKYETLHTIPKGQNLTQRTLEHFHFWGAETELRAARLVPKDYAIGGMTSYGSLLSGYHYDWMKRALVRPYYFTDNERLPQYATEAVLRARVAQIDNIDVALGWTGEDVVQSTDSATVSLVSRQGDTETVTGRYVVACDGSHSKIRDAAGITQNVSEHNRKMVLLVFRSTGLHAHLEQFEGKQFYCVLNQKYQGYWMFFGRVDLGTTWFFHAPVPDDTTKDNFDFEALLKQAAGAEFDVEFDHIGFWDLRVATAKQYRNNRVFVAGDAAHSHPPYGGYGINTGFEDARNLGWKLSAVLQGWGDARLLDSYDEERRPVFETTATHFIENFIHEDRDFLNSHDPEADQAGFELAWNKRNEGDVEVLAFAPNYDGSSIVFGQSSATPSAVGDHSMRARAGHHLAPQMFADGTNAYDHLGAGFTLFALGDADTSGFADAAQKLGLPLTIVCDPGHAARDAWGAQYVLVRPDQYVAWTGNTLPDAAAPVLAHVVAAVGKHD